jgi:hypothetical protein
MTERNGPTVETQLALMSRDIEEIRNALHGNGKDQKGLVATVDDLVAVVSRGQWSLKLVVWIGGVVAGTVAAAYHLRTALSGLFH